MTARYIVDVALRDRAETIRYNVTTVTIGHNGELTIYDYGLVAAYAAGEWASVVRVDPAVEIDALIEEGQP